MYFQSDEQFLKLAKILEIKNKGNFRGSVPIVRSTKQTQSQSSQANGFRSVLASLKIFLISERTILACWKRAFSSIQVIILIEESFMKKINANLSGLQIVFKSCSIGISLQTNDLIHKKAEVDNRKLGKWKLWFPYNNILTILSSLSFSFPQWKIRFVGKRNNL